MPLILLTFVVMLLLAAGPASAATPTSSPSVIFYTVKASRLSPSPYTSWGLFNVNLSARQTTWYTRGTISIVDIGKNVFIQGFIKSLSPIPHGFTYTGCGIGVGSVKTWVCFQGTGLSNPYGDGYDYFSILVTNGGTYTISGRLPTASIVIDID